jgi:hypothetical protein
MLCALDPAREQVLVRRLPKGALEAAAEVRGRRVCALRKRGDVKGLRVVRVDEVARAEKVAL